MFSLEDALVDQDYTITDVAPEYRKRLMPLGIMTGVNAIIRQYSKAGGPAIIQILNARYALGNGLLKHIYIEEQDI